MKYDRLERTKSKIADKEKELNSLANIYAKSDSMPEFRLKAEAEGLSRSSFMKWFRLFYFVKNNGIYGAFPWLVVIPLGTLTLMGIGVCVEFISHYSNTEGWQFLCALIFTVGILISFLLSFDTFRWISRALGKVESAVWKI